MTLSVFETMQDVLEGYRRHGHKFPAKTQGFTTSFSSPLGGHQELICLRSAELALSGQRWRLARN